MAVHRLKEMLTLNKPAYVMLSILDLSKTLMYDFHYNYIKTKYGNKEKSLFTDTDSLCYEFETSDIYQGFWKHKEKFDFSDYSKESPYKKVMYHDDMNKKVISKMKDEAAGQIITEFVGLRSKMYLYIKR